MEAINQRTVYSNFNNLTIYERFTDTQFNIFIIKYCGLALKYNLAKLSNIETLNLWLERKIVKIIPSNLAEFNSLEEVVECYFDRIKRLMDLPLLPVQKLQLEKLLCNSNIKIVLSKVLIIYIQYKRSRHDLKLYPNLVKDSDCDYEKLFKQEVYHVERRERLDKLQYSTDRKTVTTKEMQQSILKIALEENELVYSGLEVIRNWVRGKNLNDKEFEILYKLRSKNPKPGYMSAQGNNLYDPKIPLTEQLKRIRLFSIYIDNKLFFKNAKVCTQVHDIFEHWIGWSIVENEVTPFASDFLDIINKPHQSSIFSRESERWAVAFYAFGKLLVKQERYYTFLTETRLRKRLGKFKDEKIVAEALCRIDELSHKKPENIERLIFMLEDTLIDTQIESMFRGAPLIMTEKNNSYSERLQINNVLYWSFLIILFDVILKKEALLKAVMNSCYLNIESFILRLVNGEDKSIEINLTKIMNSNLADYTIVDPAVRKWIRDHLGYLSVNNRVISDFDNLNNSII